MRKTSMLLILACLCALPGTAAGQKTILIKNGKLFTITQGVVEKGDILISEGKISALGKNLSAPDGAEVVDASGLSVMPGLIDAFTNLGAADIFDENNDFEEATSPLTPHLHITDGIYPGNRFIPLARKTGITMVLCAPGESNLLSGQSALIRLAGETVGDMIVKAPAALHGSLGETPKLKYGPKNQYPSTRMGETALLRQTLMDAQAYLRKKEKYSRELAEFKGLKGKKKAAAKEPSPPQRDFKLEALIPLLEKRMPLAVRVNRLDDILTLLRINEEFDIRVLLNHASDGYRAAKDLALRKIPVLVGPSSSYHMREETSRGSLANAALLHKAGVKIAFQTGSFRNYGGLIEQARTAAAHGLPLEAARRALTLSAAEIFGVGDAFGSLEKGKNADLVLFNGDPLQSPARAVLIIIGGRVVEDLR
jgi:imidazolonepropionase-like amidohydrolase